MIDAAVKALAQLFTPPLRAVLLKAIGLALLMIIIIGIVLNRVFSALAAERRQLGRANLGLCAACAPGRRSHG